MSHQLHEQVSTGSVRPAKLFIGGITRNTTTKQLRDHFSRYGRVLDCVAMRQPDGRPRGFGYVTLDSSAAADRCLAVPQVVDGRVIDIKRAVPEGDASEVPAARLHTPGQKVASPANLLPSHFTSWAEASAMSPMCAYGFPMSPLSHVSQLGSHGLIMPEVLVTPTHMTGDAACRWPWAIDEVAQVAGAPDCVELLSRGRPGMLSTSPQAAASPWSVPSTPTAGPMAMMSASAPEFVPSKPVMSQENVASTKVKPLLFTSAPKRSVLGEITNVMRTNEALVPKKVVPTGAALATMFYESENAESVLAKKNQPFKTSHEKSLGFRENKALSICVDDEFETPAQVSPKPIADLVAEAQAMAQTAESECNSVPEVTENTMEDSLPSMGSVDHAAGNCKRCNFYPKGRCQNGKSCTFCHLPHEKRKPSRQEKRERRAAWQSQQEAGFVGDMPEELQDEDDESEDVNQIMAYPVLPGLPAVCATKLPPFLALPGAAFPMVPMSSYSRYPMPPPGLCLSSHGLEAWQPDEEVSPVRRSGAGPLLATVPMAPCTPHSIAASPTAATVKEMFLAAASPSAASMGHLLMASYVPEVSIPVSTVAQKPAMVTMATQTEGEEAAESCVATAGVEAHEEESNRLLRTWTKGELLHFRPKVQAQVSRH